MTPAKFGIGEFLKWSAAAPATWRHIYTSETLIVKNFHWNDGVPSDYARKFHPDGMGITPGWIYEVEFIAPAGNYQHLDFFTLLIHEMWLERE